MSGEKTAKQFLDTEQINWCNSCFHVKVCAHGKKIREGIRILNESFLDYGICVLPMIISCKHYYNPEVTSIVEAVNFKKLYDSMAEMMIKLGRGRKCEGCGIVLFNWEKECKYCIMNEYLSVRAITKSQLVK